jgi:polyhydroxybutyrate depolymerase
MKRFGPTPLLLLLAASHCGSDMAHDDADTVADIDQLEGELFGFPRRRPRAPAAPPTNEQPAPPEAGAPPAPAAGEATGCPESALSPGNHNLSLELDGATRTYLVHVPANVSGAAPVPLVIDLHGLSSSAAAQARLSGWRAKSDEEGFIVVHPQGLDASWNGGDLCCGTAQRNEVDDEGFMRALVARMQQDACIDPKRVYATGLSNGGAMSHLLACETADLFAATAPVSMGNGTDPCTPSRPISVVMTRGTRDRLVPFNGGIFPSAQQDFSQWAALNGCRGAPQPASDLCETFTDCNGGVEVKLCTVNAGHVLYSNAQNFSVPDVVWETFERQALP